MKQHLARTTALFMAAVLMPVFAAAKLSWKQAEEIRKHIKEPVFADYSVNITNFGAIADDGKLDTAAIQNAIKHVSEHGGGKVIVPAGSFDTGALTLLSNVNLNLEDENSVLLFTKDINETNYPIVYTHWEATPIYNYQPLIYANGAENIALTGKGTLDGQANNTDTWWNWRAKIPVEGTTKFTELQTPGMERTRQENNAGVPVGERIYGDGWFLRPNFIQTINCKNVLLEGVTLKRSPMWQVNPVMSENVIVRGMTLRSHGTNNDGVDPESCNYVLIENNIFDSGDDCIAIKSGRDRDGRELNKPSQNILIFNNEMADGHGGIALGSEMSGGIKNVFADGNKFDSPNLTYPLRIKTNARRGGVIENIYLRNSTIANVSEASVHGTMLYSEGRNGAYTPEFKNIVIENIKAHGGSYGIFLEAFAESPVKGLVIRNVEITGVKHPIRAMNWDKDAVIENVTINGVAYPSPTETKIIGVPAPGAELQADALLIAGNAKKIKYAWYMADTRHGEYAKVADGAKYTVPQAAAGKYIKVIATDNKKRANESQAYKVLRVASGNNELDRLVSRGIIDENMPVDMEKDITRIELARLLARMWDLKMPAKCFVGDIDQKSPDYAAACAVTQEGMMPLKGYMEDSEHGPKVDASRGLQIFDPYGFITREEMGSVVMSSCGVSYKNNAMSLVTTYKDGSTIGNNLTNIELGTTLGLWPRQEYFYPKKNVTWGMALDSVSRMADFAGK